MRYYAGLGGRLRVGPAQGAPPQRTQTPIPAEKVLPPLPGPNPYAGVPPPPQVRPVAYVSGEMPAAPQIPPPPTEPAGPRPEPGGTPGLAPAVRLPDPATIPPPPQAPAASPPPVAPPAAEELPAPAAAPTLPGAITLSEAMSETLQSDAKLRAAMEAIRQAEGDLKTSSLPPNPSVQINGVFLPLRTFTPERPGGPPELDVIGSWPVDWYIFGKRAAAMANAEIGVSVSNADYSDQVRQRLANTASTFYDVLEARAMLQLAQEDLASLERVERITREGVKFGGAGTIEAERARLDVLAAQSDVRTRESTLTTAKAQFRAAIGRSGQMTATDAAGSLDVPRPAAPLAVAEAVGLAERNRPDIISLRRQIAKAQSGVEVERTKARARSRPRWDINISGRSATACPTPPLLRPKWA